MKRERFSQLLNDPSTGRMTRDIAMQDLATVMAQDEKTVEQTETHCWHGEEVHRGDGFSMVSEETEPALCRFRIFGCSPHPARDGSFAEIAPEHQKLTVDSRRSPGGVLRHHPEDQVSNFFRDSFPADHSARSGNRAPVHGKSGAVPPDDGFGAHHDQGLFSSGPALSRHNPEQPVERSQSGPRMFALEHRELRPKN